MATGSLGSASLVAQAEVVLDASVWVSREIPTDPNHLAATMWANQHLQAAGYFTEPAWLLAEVAAAVSRQLSPQDAGIALALLSRLRRRHVMRFLSISSSLMRDTINIATNYGIRAGDAIYVAVARQLSIPLVSFDSDHLTKAISIITVIRP
jgi:predicted nucleic acid-binding protein